MTNAYPNSDLLEIWDIGIIAAVKDLNIAYGLIAKIQNDFAALLVFGIMMYLFEIKREPYYWWTKKKRINNIVTMILILLCAVTGSRLYLVIGGKVPIEKFFILNLDIVILCGFTILWLVLFFRFHNPSRVPKMLYYVKLSKLIAKGKSKKRIYIDTFRLSQLFLLLAFFSGIIFGHVLLLSGFGILSVILGVKWYYSVANNESKIVENCQSGLQIEYEEFLRKNKLFQNRKLVLIYISIARYVDNNFSLLLFSALLH